uniref:CCD97-like C-terminal domain-containing protein n=1 Tax=Kalanchoe fedtschenkoi TaxID=63787 RepID=A0A7N1A562_KALFE
MAATDTATFEARESIAERLSENGDLYFPRTVQAVAAVSQSQRKSILLDLLSRDAAVFLERYGAKLTSEELKYFDALDSDYEINWHLKHLRSIMSPTADELRSRSAKVKNRRRAFMDKLIYDGQYFSEDAMREREPYLHYEYIGKFQDMTGRRMARPGERWSDTLMRRSEEAMLIAKIRSEQQRLGVAEKDWVGNERLQEEETDEMEEEEEEEEMEEEEEEEKERQVNENGGMAKEPEQGSQALKVAPDHAAAETLQQIEKEIPSAEELQDRMEQFTILMQEKFLAGDDTEHVDYAKIDEDETLDDHWSKEANLDAEEKYFDQD